MTSTQPGTSPAEDPDPRPGHGRPPWSRRGFLRAAGVAGLAPAAVRLTSPAAAAGGVPPAGAPPAGGPVIDGLTTEHMVAPLGVDVAQPLFGWQIGPGHAGWSQSAYQLIVASTENAVRRGAADVWDSGKVSSAQSVDAAYSGPPLASGTRYYWAVRVWDADGHVSGWSPPSWWEMGLLSEPDWAGAQWIGPQPPAMPSLDGAHWIWYPEGPSQSAFPAETRYFRTTWQLPGGAQIAAATLVMTADDYYTVYVNGVLAGNPGSVPNGWQTAQTYDIAALLKPGANTIAAAATNLQASTPSGMVNTPAGLLGRVHVTLSAGSVPDVVTDATWKTAQTVPSGWEQPGFDDSAWVTALDEGAYGGGPWDHAVRVAAKVPAPYLRRQFTVAGPVRRARLYVCGLGYYVASINGRRVGDHVLDPAPTVYNERVLYASYDVTDHVRPGGNAIGVVLGRGFYAIDSPNSYWNTAPWLSAAPALLLKLDVELMDGTRATVTSGSGWLTHDSPTRSDSVYNGEIYDARASIAGWDRPGTPTSGWAVPTVRQAPAPAVRSQLMPPIRVVSTVGAVSVTSPRAGTYVYKFPAVVAGWPRISVSAPAGTQVTVRYGEVLNADGTVNNAGDPGITPGEIQRDTYITAGAGTEVWEPQFSYGSFQYIQLDGLPAAPGQEAALARVAHTDVTVTGDFHCGDALLNTIHTMTRRTILNNLTGIPTDTPMYEKRGWFGDAQLYTAAAVDNFDMHTFLANFLEVMADDQGSDGNYGDLAPANGPGEGADPTWSSAGLVIPWRLYQEYGDSRVLAQHYEGMRAFVDYLTSRASSSIVTGTYGDWVAPRPPDGSYAAPPEGTALVSTASYYRSAVLLAQIAQVLSKGPDASKYASLASTIKNAFNAAFLDSSAGLYQTSIPAGYRQTSNAFPLYLGMVPQAQVSAVVGNLVGGIAAAGNHLDTGIIGTMALFPALTMNGQVDLAYTVATQRTFPSYGYWVSLGATTLWEEWQPAPRSHDHAMFGTVDDWFFKYLAGIQPAAPGYRQVAVRPYPPSGLAEVDAHQGTPYGRVAVRWRSAGRAFTLSVTIPPGASGTVSVPAPAGSRVSAPPGAVPLRRAGGYASYRTGAGDYTFTAGG